MPDETPKDQLSTDEVSRTALLTIIVVLVVMALVALHLNWVRWQRDKIEKVIVTPLATPAATP